MSTQVESVSSFSLLASYSGTATTIIVEDIYQGGTFVIYSTTPLPTVDNLIFYTSNSPTTKVWERQFTESEAINISWAGAKSDVVFGTGSVVSGSTTLTVTGANFTMPDSGKMITLAGGQYDAASARFIDLTTTITYATTTTVTLGTAPTGITPPSSAPTFVTSSGGAIPSGTYNYYIVALTLYSNSVPSTIPSALATNTAGNGTNTVSWGVVTGAIAYQVYRIKAGGAGTSASYLVQASGSPSFTDVGTVNTNSIALPSTTPTFSFNYGTDNTNAIQKVLNLPYNVLIPSGCTFKATGNLISSISKRKISAYGATIIRNMDVMHVDAFLYFRASGTLNATNLLTEIVIEGGTWTNPYPLEGSAPSGQTAGQHCFQFNYCTNIQILNTHINGSPEMGIGMNQVANVVVSGNTIENCYRDGIYSQYSCFLKYTNNTLRNIKDDSMSIHDYGDSSLKDLLTLYNLQQAGEAIVSGNIVQYAFEGFSSIAGAGISIYGNEFSNTVGGAVNCANTELSNSTLYPSTTRLRRIDIHNNVCRFNCATTTIMGIPIPNNGQPGGGVAAIEVQSQGTDGFYASAPLDFRSSNINIENNKVYNCATNAIMAHQVDGLTITDNYAYDCYTVTAAFGNMGYIYLVINCTLASILKNDAIDDNATPLQVKGYSIQNTSGVMDLWNVNAWLDTAAGEVTGTALISSYTPDYLRKTVKAASTASVTTSGTMTIDTVALAVGDLVLLKDQSTGTQNGIYMVRSGSWTRTADASIGSQLLGAIVYVQSGTANGTKQFINANNTIPLVGTSIIPFIQTYLSALASASDLAAVTTSSTKIVASYNVTGLSNYMIYVYLTVTSIGSASLQVNVTYWDELNTTMKTQVLIGTNASGAAFTTITANGNYVYASVMVRANGTAGTPRVLAVNVTTTASATYDTGARVIVI